MRQNRIILLFVGAILMLGLIGCTSSSTTTGNAVKKIDKTEVIEIKGSDTLLQLVSNMAEAFSDENPSYKISVSGGGSGTGIAALLNGEVDIADSSRAIKQSEIDLAAGKGMEINELRVARDMLSVIINPDNNINEMTMTDIGRIFKGEITNWKEVGGEDKEITLYGRQSTSGTYTFFMEHVVQDDYSPEMRNLEGNQAILDAVMQDKSGIGYVGLGYIVDEGGNQVVGIRVLKVSDGGEAISPLDMKRLAEYPISRPLYQYYANIPTKGSSVHDFILFELSDLGKEIVTKTGFVDLTTQDVQVNNVFLSKIR